MTTKQPLTLTVEQAAQVLGVGRSTAYELVRRGDLACIRLRRRIVIPIAHLAGRLGVERDALWALLASAEPGEPESPASAPPSPRSTPRRLGATDEEPPSLF